MVAFIHAFISASVLLFINLAYAADWSSCESDLSRAGRMARDAAAMASDLDSMKRELENLKDDYENCLRFPDVYDLMGDGCQSRRDDYSDKVQEYNAHLDELGSQLSDFVSRAKRAISECGY